MSGCAQPVLQDYYDTDAKASRQDYREAMAAREPVARDEPAPAIPELQSIISVPELEIRPAARRVTVTISESTPLKEVLIELAREARVDLELDPAIEGGVIFSARQRPFEEVMRRLADLAGLRFTIADNVVRIELDTPYHVNYRINYLNVVRTATSEISTSASVVGGAAGGAQGGGNASSSSVSGTSTADFWTELEANIGQILTNTRPAAGLVAPPPPVAAEPTVAAPPTVGEAEAPAEAAAEAPAEAAPTVAERLAELVAPAEAEPAPAAPAAPAAEAPAAAPAAPTAAVAPVDVTNLFTVNRQAGIVSVFGTQRQHRAIEAYLDKLRASVGGQVLIEAKVLEVRLNEQFRYGIDWRSIIGGKTNITGDFAFRAPTGVTDIVQLTLAGDLDEIVRFIETFGVVRALSSPRLTVLNNQTAVLKVAENNVFFEVEIEQATTSGDTPVTTTSVTSTINTVTVGLVMTVQPSIDVETDEITLMLRPTITRVIGEGKSDPAVEIQAKTAAADADTDELRNALIGLRSFIPEIAVQEMDSVVTIRSGRVLVMGGLMQDSTTIDETGVPLLSEVPFLGYLFKARSTTTEKIELVILLRATIVRRTTVDPADADLYKRFGQDRRPFSL